MEITHQMKEIVGIWKYDFHQKKTEKDPRIDKTEHLYLREDGRCQFEKKHKTKQDDDNYSTDNCAIPSTGIQKDFMKTPSPTGGTWKVNGDVLTITGSASIGIGVIVDGDLSGHAGGRRDGHCVKYSVSELKSGKFTHITQYSMEDMFLQQEEERKKEAGEKKG